MCAAIMHCVVKVMNLFVSVRDLASDSIQYTHIDKQIEDMNSDTIFRIV